MAWDQSSIPILKPDEMKRRDFIKIAGVGAVSTTLGLSSRFPSKERPRTRHISDLLDSDYPFPYDSDCFEAGERIVFLSPAEANISIIPKEGKALDIKLFFHHEDKMHICSAESLTYYGVNDVLEIPIKRQFWNPEFQYRLEYRDTGKDKWNSTPMRTVKTPRFRLEDRNLEVILIGDDHTPDDADLGEIVLEDDDLKELRLNGDYVNLFLKKLIEDPEYFPERGSELAKLMSGFCLASTIRQILVSENPDFIIDLGDHRGGFGHKWEGLGLKNQHEVSEEERDQYEVIFRKGTRKIFSALTPEIPIYWVLGNHDGESGYDATLNAATQYRKKFFKLPGTFRGESVDENYYSLIWGRYKGDNWLLESREGGVLFVILDTQRYNLSIPRIPEDWTLGENQKEWFKKILKYDAEKKFVLQHHVLGGWPSGSDETRLDIAYGRGPLFTYDDYRDICKNPDQIEQVELTRLMKENDVDVVFYGHDHIFHVKEIGQEDNRKRMVGICVGSTKHIGEMNWYKGEFWKKYYGDYGSYWGHAEKADFWGPSGYTKLTINRETTKVEYIRSAHNHPFTNIPKHIEVGDVIHTLIL